MSPFALVSLRRALALAVTFFLFSVAGLKNSSNRTLVAATPTARLRPARAGLPLSFEPNMGQADPRVKFVSRGREYTLFLTKDEAVLRMQKSEVRSQKSGARIQFAPPSVLRLKLRGANTGASVVGLDELLGKSNYFVGKDPKQWRTNLPTYARVRYQNVYPGVDLVYYGNQGGQLECDFVIAPGADPSAIALSIGAAGQAGSRRKAEGRKQKAEGSGRKAVGSKQKAVGRKQKAEGRKQKAVGALLQSQTESSRSCRQRHPETMKMIPLLVKEGSGVVDRNAEAATHHPLPPPPAEEGSHFQSGQLTKDHGQLTSFDSGSEIRNRKSKIPSSLRVASNGDLVVALPGGELRFHKPVVYQQQSTVDSRQPTVESSRSCRQRHPETMKIIPLLVKEGSGVVGRDATLPPTTPLPPPPAEEGSHFQSRQLTTDHGQLTSFDSRSEIQNPKSIDGRYVLKPDGVVTFEIAPYDRALPLVIDPILSYSTFLGGSDMDYANGIAVDASGNAYVTGYTASTDFPLVNPAQGSPGGGACSEDGVDTVPCFDAFVSKLNSTGTALVYSTYLGGSNEDYGAAIAVDASGDAYVAGYTYSTDFPVQNALQPQNAGGWDAFVTELSADGASLIYSTYWGGSLDDVGTGIAVDSGGNAYLSGYTDSTDFPVSSGAFQANFGGGTHNAFVVRFNRGGAQVGYSTYLGGSGDDYAYAAAVDTLGDAYVAGATNSTDFPTASALQPNFAGGLCGTAPNTFPCYDAFVCKLNPAGSALIFSTYLGGTGSDYGYAIALDASSNAYVTGYTTSKNFPTTPGAFEQTYGGSYDVFVSKLNGAGSTLDYSTYLGGSGTQVAYGIAVDSNGSAYLTGYNYGGNFPTANPEQAQNAGYYDAFVSVLDPTGSFLSFSTYLGGGQDDFGRGIALDPSGNVYVAGATFSTDFPTTAGSFQSTYVGGPYDAFVTMYKAPVLPLVSLSPSSYDFGNQAVGATSSAETITLANDGNAALTISSIAVSGDFSQTNTCGSSVAANSACTISVTFAPTAAGSRTGSITIADNASPATQTVNLSGTGAAPAVSLSPTSLTFSSQAVGTSSSPQTLTLNNTGNAGLTISSIAVSGDFSQTNTCSSSVAANSACTISVTFKPTTTGTRSGTVTITDNVNPGIQTASLSGTGAVPGASVSPTSLTFASQAEGSSSSPQNVTLTNTGNATLTISSITISGDFSQTNTCGSSVGANSSCTISVTFKPTTTGTRSGTVTITDNASPSTQTVGLTGTGALPPAVSLNPTSLTFPSEGVGVSSSAQSVTLKNTGKGTLTISSIATSGDFSQTNTCGSSVAANANCTIKITFKPTATGTRTGTVTITDNASPPTQTVSLSGTGAGPAVSLSPVSLTFPSQAVGTSSAAQRVTLKNTGKGTLSISSIATSGDFSQTNTCGSSVAASATCTIGVTFKPTATGTRTGAVKITDNASPSTQTVSLTGTGGGSKGVKFTPPALTFPAQTVGSTSCAQIVTLSNTGDATLSIASIAASGDSVQTNDCGSSLAVNASCTLNVAFSPIAGGSRTGAVSVTDSAPGSPQTVTITGAGEDFMFAGSSVSSNSASVSSGGTATYSVGILPVGGFNQSVAFTCTGAPLKASCTASPASITLSTSTNITVTVATTASSLGLPQQNPPPIGSPQPGLWLLWTIALLASGSSALAIRNRARPSTGRRLTGLAICAALFLVALAMVACGGGGGGLAPPPTSSGTPQGTYTLTVTGACTSCSVSLNHSVNLTLQVQ